MLGSVALLPVAAYLWVALHRIGYPYELEWLEGGAVSIVQRAHAGHGLYVAPSLHYVPWPYPPLYFWVSAGVAQVTGVGFLALRLVSFTASLGTFAVIFVMVRSSTRDRVAGLCAVGLFTATFRLTGAWLDIGRVDSLFLLLLLLAALVARRAGSWRGGVLVGALVFLAFFTKQTALVAALPLVVWLVVRRPRAGVAALGTSVLLVVGSTLVMNALSHGWYGYYVFGELSHQPLVSAAVPGFWTHDLVHPLGIALLVGAAGVLGRWTSRSAGGFAAPGGAPSPPSAALSANTGRRGPLPRRRPSHSRSPFRPDVLGFDLVVVLGLVGASWVGRVHSGGSGDVLIPAAAGVALLVGSACAHLRRAAPGGWGWFATIVLAGLLLVQVDQLRYPISAQIPTAADRRAGDQLVASLRGLPGQVVVVDHPWYAALAGKGTSAQGQAIREVLRSGDDRGRTALSRDLPTDIASPAVGAVVVDAPEDEWGFADALERQFVAAPSPLISGHVFYPVTDLGLRPTELFVRRTVPR
jgi:hypothetical protein